MMWVIFLTEPLHRCIWVMSFPCEWIYTSTTRLTLSVPHIGHCLRICCTHVCWDLLLCRHEERFLVWHLRWICINLIGCRHRIECIVYLCKLGLCIVLFCPVRSLFQFFFSLPDSSILLCLKLLFWSHFRRLLWPSLVLNSGRHGWAHSILISGTCHWWVEVWFITLSNTCGLQILCELVAHWMFEIWLFIFFSVLVNIFYLFSSSLYSRLSLLI